MKIIRHGITYCPDNPVRFACMKCGCIFVMTGEEVTWLSNRLYDPKESVLLRQAKTTCPECDSLVIGFATNSEEEDK